MAGTPSVACGGSSGASSCGLELPISLGATLHVRTRVGGFRKVWARRRTDLSLDDGSPAGWLHTDWVITDVRGAPQRIPEAFPAAFAAPPGGFEPVRVAATTPAADAVESTSPSCRTSSTRWTT